MITSNGLQLLKVIWFSNRHGSMGIGVFRNQWLENKAYISMGSGQSEKEDIGHLACYGAKISSNQLKELLKSLES